MRLKITLSITTLLFAFTTLWGQTIEVQGHVVDENREPVVGATIRLKKDQNKGAYTNPQGFFKIQAQKGEILIVTYIGYKTQEVKAEAKMTIRLLPDAELLDEVVVVGYGSGRAINTTTASVVKVDAKDLESKPVANVLEGLQGKVSGLAVATSSGEPGQLSSIVLHGSGSLGLGSAPMYILDGMPVAQGTIMGLNQNDFESVQVLKDASATSIYGSRAANGVIFITTKRGQAAQRATITLNTQYGISNLANRTFYDSMMSADELADFWVGAGIRTQEYVDQLRKEYPYNTNWTDYFYRKNAPMYNASLSISGGANNIQYYISGQHFFQQGLFAGKTEYTKSNLRANISARVNDWLTLSLNNGVYYDNSISSNSGHDSYTSGGLFYWILPFYTPYKDIDKGELYYDERIPGYNWYGHQYLSDMQKQLYSTFEYIGNISAKISPLPGLVFRSNIGLDFSNYYGNYQRDPRAKWQLQNGSRSDSFSRGIEWTFTNTAEYSFDIYDDHHFTFLLGHEFNRYDGNGFSASGSELKDYRLMHLGQVVKGEKKSIGSSLSQYAYLSFFGRLSYSLLDRYHIDLTVRNDASSKFPPRKRHATFWSAGIKWNAKKESFLENVSWLDRLDAKFSIGTAGNSALGNYAYFATAANSDNYKGQPSRVIGDVGNPDLTWEQQRKTTIGFDAQIFRKLGINFEVYDRHTTAMVMSVPYPYTTGVSSNVQNVGAYQNRGFDLRIDYTPYQDRSGNFVSVYGLINYNRDKILSLFQGLDTWLMPNYLLAYQVGKPVMYLMPIFKQINPETGDPEWYVPGDDPGVTQKDDSKFVVGHDFNEEFLQQNTGINRNTPFQGGFGLEAEYKGFFCSANFAFFLGKHMINNDLNFAMNPKRFPNQNTSKKSKNYWRQPGDQVQLPDIKRYQVGMQFDTRMLLDASFLRLKSLSVGYNIPQKYLAGQSFFRSVKIGITGRNLFTFTKYYGSDPEAATNLTYGMNPATRQFVGSLEIKF